MGCFLDYENQSPIDMIKMEKRCKILDTGRKDANIQIGKRLREARLNMNLEKSEIADVLDVTVEHYRKLEAGVTGISVVDLYLKLTRDLRGKLIHPRGQ